MTTRRIMGMVIGLALTLGLGLPAVEVAAERDEHIHVFYTLRDRQLGSGTDRRYATPFWPRYRQCFLGRPWKRQPICGPGAGRIGETCEYARPDLVDRFGSDRIVGRPPLRIGGGPPLEEGDVVPEGWNPPFPIAR